MQLAGLLGGSGFGEVLRRRAAESAGARAFSFVGAAGEVERTYGELDRAARAVAVRLGECARPGDRVLILRPPGPGYVESFWGCLYAGVVAVPAYPPDLNWLGRSLPRLRALVADCGARVALTTPEVARAFGPGGAAEGGLGPLAWVADAPEAGAEGAYRAPALAPSSLALLQYTSGSTGQPKGVMVTHGNLAHNAELVRQGFESSAESVGVIWLPPYHDMGLIGGVLQPAYAGFPVVLMSPLAFLRRPLRWLELVSERGGTVSGGPDFAFDLCVRKTTPAERARLDLGRWRVAFCGAEPVRAETLDRFADAFAPAGFRREAFYPCYGLAENTLIVTGGARPAPPLVRRFAREALREGRAEPADGGAPLVGCGRALGDQRLAVVDPDTGAPRPEGREGEIWVSGPSVAAGYWQRPDESREAFGARLAPPGDGRTYLRTGDLGFLQSNELFVTGRRKDLIIVRGQNHYPQDVERTVAGAHPALRPDGAAAFSVDGEGGEGLGVACELAPGGAARAGEALAAIVRRVAEEHELAPRVVLLLKPGGLPRTSSGKVRRRACRQGYEDGSLEAVARHDEGSPTEAAPTGEGPPGPGGGGPAGWLRGRIAAALGLPPEALAEDVPIVQYGLDSLRAIELEGELEAAFGVEVPGTLLLRGATLRELARRLEAGARPASVGAEAGAPDGASGPAQGAGPNDARALAEGAGSGEAGRSGGVVERPASEGQRALWFLQRLAPEGGAYHVARAFRLRAPPDVGALGRALDALVDRHPSLRASFRERGGAVFERVAPRASPTLEVVDARDLDEAALELRLNEEARRPFDLAEGPLFRARLFERAEGARLLLCFHHLVTDFWSLGVLAGELGPLYDAARSGEAPHLPLAGATPAAIEGARGPSEAERERALRYWREALGGAPPALDVPTDWPRPRLQSFRGARVVLSASAETRARVGALARECETTIYTALLAAFALFLHRYTGERDLVVGTPSAGRRGPGRARAVGYFVNPLALRLGLDPGQSFRELVRRARAVVLGALEHADLPFSHLVEALRPPRDPGRAPLVQVMFALQTPPPATPGLGGAALGRPGVRARLGGLELESVALEHEGSAFDLSLMMAEVGGELGGTLEYRADLFDAESAGAMARHFVALLEASVGAPDLPLWRLSPLDDGDRGRLRAWAGRAEPRGEPSRDVLHRLFAGRAAEAPEAPALSFRGEVLSYRELDARSSRLANHLRRLGVGTEARVGVCLERGPDVAIAFWAVIKAAGAYVPIEPGTPAERVAWTAADAGLELVITQSAVAAGLPPLGAELLCLDRAGGALQRESAEAPAAADRPEGLAYVIYTSGSTGTPKGVMVTHRGASNLARAQRDRLDVGPGDRVAQYCPSNFDISVWDMLMAHLNGACLHPTPAEAVPPGPALVEHLERERVSVATLLPSVLGALPRCELPALRLLVSGAEVCTPDLVERWAPGRTFFNAYGPTEITVCCAFDACAPDGTMPPIGRPVRGATAYVLDGALGPAPAGAPGELYVGGAGVARGYLGRPGLTAERFLPDPFSDEPGARMYKTGDRVRWGPGGRLEFLGRLDAQIKLRGFRIEPGEIEARLREDLGAREAAVVASPGPEGRARLWAYVVAGGRRWPAREARAALRARLPEYMIPSGFVWLDALPLMPNGKVDRKALPAPEEAEGGAERPFVPPRDALEGLLAGAWAEALGRARVGAREHFFEDLGGGSLDVVKACSLIGERRGREVPVTHLFEHPTVEGLAERLRRDEAGEGPTGAPAARAEGRAEARRAALARLGRKGG